MKIGYLGLAAAVIFSACTKEDNNGKPSGDKEGMVIKVGSLSSPSRNEAHSDSDPQEQDQGFLTVTYEAVEMTEESTSRQGEYGIADESALDFVDVWHQAENMVSYSASFVNQRVESSDMEGPYYNEGWGQYTYRFYVAPPELPSPYVFSGKRYYLGNVEEGVFREGEITMEDYESLSYINRIVYENEADVTKNRRLQFIGKADTFDTHVELQRIQAKLDVTVTVGESGGGVNSVPMSRWDADEYKITAIQVRNVARTFSYDPMLYSWQLFPYNMRTPLPYDLEYDYPYDYTMRDPDTDPEEKDRKKYYMDYEEVTGTDIGRVEGGDRFVWYVTPNFDDWNGSEGSGQSYDPTTKTLQRGPSHFFPTHIVLKGICKNKPFTVTVCPGNSNIEYSIRPNTWYKIKIDLKELPSPINDARVDFPEGKPSN